MAILSSMINTLSCYNADVLKMEDEATFENAAARLLAKIRTVAAAAYKTSVGEPIVYPNPKYDYCTNFLHMMFSIPHRPYEPDRIWSRRSSLFLLLHADHEQNCSTSTVRMVGSSGANLFASCAAGVCALWGPLHGGANVAVVEQLERIHKSGMSVAELIERVKRKEERLFGFGHAVYASYDPRAHILRDHAPKVVAKLGRPGPAAGYRQATGRSRAERRLLHQPQPVPQCGLLFRGDPAGVGHSDQHVHRHVCDRPHAGLDCPVERTARQPSPHLPPAADLHGPCETRLRSDQPARKPTAACRCSNRRLRPATASTSSGTDTPRCGGRNPSPSSPRSA